MRQRLTVIFILLGLLFLTGFAVILVNQTIQFVAFADRLSPVAGDIALWSILTIYGFCLSVPIYLFFMLPSPLIPPDQSTGKTYEKFLNKLRKRLANNPHIHRSLETSSDIEAALSQLDKLADEHTKATATQLFLLTAISQNGKLDALFVLAAQSKIIFEIARIYYQRPTLRDLIYLYSNIAATVFVATELEDIDLTEQIQPILNAVLGSAVSAIPGMSAASGLFVNSVTTGTANAFLTLRVGIIARLYCRSLTKPDRRSIRHSATLQAGRLLGSIVREGAVQVAAKIWSKPKKYFTELIELFNRKSREPKGEPI
ncbi:MAG TPA: hypothetical protein DCR97_03430 [Deltaproteobacteria bacterium]|nr:hypothetical protein [Deltaproteobacteria bacterium]